MEGELPNCEAFKELVDLQKRVRELQHQDAWVFVFHGQRGHVTRGPLRYLIVPDQIPVPLFDVPVLDKLVLCEDGYLGSEVAEPDDDADEVPVELAKPVDAGGELEGDFELADGAAEPEGDFYFDDGSESVG